MRLLVSTRQDALRWLVVPSFAFAACAGSDGVGDAGTTTGITSGVNTAMVDSGGGDGGNAEGGSSTTSSASGSTTGASGPPFPVPARPTSTLTGYRGYCAVLQDHSLYCFDPDDLTHSPDSEPVPSENHGFITAGAAAALRENGEAVFWDAQGEVPEEGPYIAVRGSASSGRCALDTQGVGHCITALSDETYPGPYDHYIPMSKHFCGVRADDTGVDCHGLNEEPTWNLETPDDPILFAEGAVSSLCAFTRSGKLTCWDAPTSPSGGWTTEELPVRGDVVDLSYGNRVLCWLLRSGGLGCWDRDLGRELVFAFPVDQGYVAVFVSNHICVVNEDAELFCGDESQLVQVPLPMPVLLPPPPLAPQTTTQ